MCSLLNILPGWESREKDDFRLGREREREGEGGGVFSVCIFGD